MTVEELYQIIVNRKRIMPKDSYVVSLLRNGNDRIIQKVGEEAVEVVIAAKNSSRKRLISEVADLWFHILILLAVKDISPEDILKELESRNKK